MPRELQDYNSCVASALTELVPPDIDDIVYTLTEPQTNVNFPGFISSPTVCVCDYSYDFGALGDVGFQNLFKQFTAFEFPTFQIRQFSYGDYMDFSVLENGKLDTTYELEIKAVVRDNPGIKATAKFNITVKNPCRDATKIFINDVYPDDKIYSLFADPLVWTH